MNTTPINQVFLGVTLVEIEQSKEDAENWVKPNGKKYGLLGKEVKYFRLIGLTHQHLFTQVLLEILSKMK